MFVHARKLPQSSILFGMVGARAASGMVILLAVGLGLLAVKVNDHHPPRRLDYPPNSRNHSSRETTTKTKTTTKTCLANTTDDDDDQWRTSYPKRWALGADRCTIPRIPESDLTPLQFATEYWRRKPLIVVRSHTTTNERAQQLTTKQRLRESFEGSDVRFTTYESYAFKSQEVRGNFGSYIESLTQVTEETGGNTSFAFGADPFGLGEHYVVPSVVTALQEQLHLEWHYQTAVAGSGAGLAFHWHGDVFAETLHGRRRWFLYPPEISPVFNPRETSVRWLSRVYSPWLRDASSEPGNDQTAALLECTIEPNEAIYVPADWFHATLSLGEAVSITTSFSSTLRKDIRQYDHANVDEASYTHIQMLDALGARQYEKAIQLGTRLIQLRPRNFVPYGWLGIIQTLYTQSLGSLQTNGAGGGGSRSSSSSTDGSSATASTLEDRIVISLEAGRNFTARCITLNPFYAPCHVWYARQCTALAMILQSTNPQRSIDLRREARESQSIARQLSPPSSESGEHHPSTGGYHGMDDEMLDPRWKPKAWVTTKS